MLRDGRQHLSPMAERHTKVLEVLVGEMPKDRYIDLVLCKTLRVLGHAECFEPTRKVLHCAHPRRRSLEPL